MRFRLHDEVYRLSSISEGETYWFPPVVVAIRDYALVYSYSEEGCRAFRRAVETCAIAMTGGFND